MKPPSPAFRRFLQQHIVRWGERLRLQAAARRAKRAAPSTKEVHRMHRDYLRLRSINKVANLYGRHPFKVFGLFKNAGLHVFPKKFKRRIVHNGVTYTPHGRPGADYFCATTGARGLLHHAIWVERNGPIPAGHNIYFQNGDRYNCALDNLVCLKIGRAHRKDSPLAKVRKAQDRSYRRAIPPGDIPALHAKYAAGASLISLASPYGQSDRWLKGLFIRHGYPLREAACQKTGRRHAGAMAAAPRLTRTQINAIADGLKKIRVPDCLQSEWQHWSLARRGEFIARVRERLKPRNRRPELPFSANVTPFDYATPQAHAIAATTTSEKDRHVIRICSEGVIWRGQLFYWNSQGHCYEKQETDTRGRIALTRMIWEHAQGRPVPPGLVVICRDGNSNNLSPANLHAISRDDLLRENQAASLFKISREQTAILLNRSQQPHKPHEHSDPLQAFHRR